MANKALPWRRILLAAWTWPPVLTICPDTRTVRGDLNVRPPRLPATLFLAIHSFLPETLTKKVTVNPQKRLLFPPSFFSPSLCIISNDFFVFNCLSYRIPAGADLHAEGQVHVRVCKSRV
jgi:hypothetical protein